VEGVNINKKKGREGESGSLSEEMVIRYKNKRREGFKEMRPPKRSLNTYSRATAGT